MRREPIAPIRKTHGASTSPRFDDTGFSSARVTDVWIRDAQGRHACEHVIKALREMPPLDRDGDNVEILSGIEHVNASNDGKVAPSAVPTHAARRHDASAAFAQSFFP
ncbi:darcynin family protein [Burkholderia aenigmatica]|uniref:darcynin family protein n=1 Tax=Burkholderia aenigmatica TaxID=2015348 RepID=UPI003454790A